MENKVMASRKINLTGTLSYPHLLEPSRPTNTPSAELKYSLNLIFNPANSIDLTSQNLLVQTINEVASEQWGEYAQHYLSNANLYPVRAKDGKYFVKASTNTQNPPFLAVWEESLSQYVIMSTEQVGSFLYPGARVEIQVLVRTYEVGQNVSVHLLLNGVAFLEHGERIDDRDNVNTMFSGNRTQAQMTGGQPPMPGQPQPQTQPQPGYQQGQPQPGYQQGQPQPQQQQQMGQPQQQQQMGQPQQTAPPGYQAPPPSHLPPQQPIPQVGQPQPGFTPAPVKFDPTKPIGS